MKWLEPTKCGHFVRYNRVWLYFEFYRIDARYFYLKSAYKSGRFKWHLFFCYILVGAQRYGGLLRHCPRQRFLHWTEPWRNAKFSLDWSFEVQSNFLMLSILSTTALIFVSNLLFLKLPLNNNRLSWTATNLGSQGCLTYTGWL